MRLCLFEPSRAASFAEHCGYSVDISVPASISDSAVAGGICCGVGYLYTVAPPQVEAFSVVTERSVGTKTGNTLTRELEQSAADGKLKCHAEG